ncbi:MAG: universal stress protein [Bacillota bacterium]|nr:universal stress protein [Bacillota bacterium]
MFNKVLLAMDSSSAARELFNCIPDLRIMGMKELVIIHSISVDQLQGKSLDNYRQVFAGRIEEKIKAIEQKEIAVKLLMPFGHAAEEIALAAEEENVDLILIGSIGENIVREFLLGSTVTEVIRRTNKPLLIEKYIHLGEGTRLLPICFQKLATVLLPTDFSPDSDRVYRKFLSAAGKIHRIILLNVVDKGQSAGEISQQEQKAADRLKEWQKKFNKKDGSVDIKISTGVTSQEIVSIVESEGVTLVAMPTKGLGLAKLIMGRTAEAVMRRSNCPVLLFKVK